MSKRTELAEILKSEYGICSVADLEKAIERLGSVDISLFCTEIKQTRRKRKDMSCGVQLEAYAKALESHGIKVDQKMILHLKRNGKFKPIFYPENDSQRWRVFGSLKVVYDYIMSCNH